MTYTTEDGWAWLFANVDHYTARTTRNGSSAGTATSPQGAPTSSPSLTDYTPTVLSHVAPDNRGDVVEAEGVCDEPGDVHRES